MRQTNGLSPEVKEKLISNFINSAQGRQKLAQSMAQPLRTTKDYNGGWVICPACGETVWSSQLATHASAFNDVEHTVVEVMES